MPSDPITDLGVRLRQPIPTGADFEPWAFEAKERPALTQGGTPKKDGRYHGLHGIPCVLAVLMDAGYTDDQIQVAFADLSHRRWAPSAETLRGMS